MGVDARTTKANRSNIPVLVICRNGDLALKIRQCLTHLGYSQISTATTHGQGIERLKARRFDFAIIDSTTTDISALDFINQCKVLQGPSAILALSTHPSVDNVFALLKAGARGFVVTPFTVDSFEVAMNSAFAGPALSEAILEARDRNAALAGLVLNSLYKLTSRIKYSRAHPYALDKTELERAHLIEAMGLAMTFCEGGPGLLRDSIMDGCTQRAETAATKLGRTRLRLQAQRQEKAKEAA